VEPGVGEEEDIRGGKGKIGFLWTWRRRQPLMVWGGGDILSISPKLFIIIISSLSRMQFFSEMQRVQLLY
jgi:hypothetical protein